MLIEVYIYVYFKFDVKLSNKNSEEIMDVFKIERQYKKI